MKIHEIKKRSVCIVSFGPFHQNDDGTWPLAFGCQAGQFYQVTIDPNRCSGTGEFIKCGTFPGDELIGWQLVDGLTVQEVLAEWDGDEPPIMNFGSLTE